MICSLVEELSRRAAAAVYQPPEKYLNWENIRSGKVLESLPCLVLPLNKQIQSEPEQYPIRRTFQHISTYLCMHKNISLRD